jgi:uncharacterized protein YjbK
MSDTYHINREIEIKLDLGSFTNYLKLVGFLGKIDYEEQQVNGFFDSEDKLLSKEGWALRVRTENKRGLITLKSKSSADRLASIRDEIEAEINRGDAMEILNLRRDILDLDTPPVTFVKEKWGKLHLTKLVHFENNRQRKQFKIGDRSYYLLIDTTSFSDGSTDYELEVEISDERQIEFVHDNLHKLFISLEIPFVLQQQSKFARAQAKTKVF